MLRRLRLFAAAAAALSKQGLRSLSARRLRQAGLPQTRCPVSDLICREQCIWLEQHLLLGSRADNDDIVEAFEKVYEHREALNQAPCRRGEPGERAACRTLVSFGR